MNTRLRRIERVFLLIGLLAVVVYGAKPSLFVLLPSLCALVV